MNAGTKAYRKVLMADPIKATIEELHDDYELLLAWVKKMQRVGNADGAPTRLPQDIPKLPYKMSKIEGRNQMLSPRTRASHARLVCVRGVSHNYAIGYLLEHGLIPCAVNASETGNGMPFNNWNKVRYAYYIAYCFAEGLCKFHDEARQVLMYVFYGRYKSARGCDAPVIRAIHASVQRQTLRLNANDLVADFSDVLQLLHDNPRYKKFLTDKGAGKAPPEYLVAWEKGFRTAARDKTLANDG